MPMPKGLALVVATVAALGGVGRAADSLGPRTKEKPFFDARSRATEYAGPGRETPEPADVAEVLLGYFGPSDPADREGGDAWRAAQLALDEVNRQGGYRGKPFRLVPGWSDQPWKDGATQVTRMVYGHQVWAVLGGPDGTTTHLAEQVVAKARLALVSPGSTDRTANLANVPWMFSMLPGDHLQAPPLAAELASLLEGRPFGIISGEDHDARQFVLELHRACTALRLQPQWQYVCPSAQDVPEVVAKVLDAKPAAVVIAAGALR
ncbi:MAG: ABC transporter substrate-binding protein, partial [Thermoguttaceae bacterium]|nr:ABC transporter substrate-binding protein [Thermoguttaceae bacterium]